MYCSSHCGCILSAPSTTSGPLVCSFPTSVLLYPLLTSYHMLTYMLSWFQQLTFLKKMLTLSCVGFVLPHSQRQMLIKEQIRAKSLENTSAFQGEPVIFIPLQVSFWQSLCSPCILTLSSFVGLSSKMRSYYYVPLSQLQV